MEKTCDKCKVSLPIGEFKIRKEGNNYITSDTCENCLPETILKVRLANSKWNSKKINKTVKKKAITSGLSASEEESVKRLLEDGVSHRTIKKMFPINNEQLEAIL